MATDLFKTKTRKETTIPYVSHLLAVCAIVQEHGGTEAEAIGALLHDVLEDIEPAERADAALEPFGEAVRAIVVGCTDGRPDPTGKKAKWLDRKTRYIARVAHEPASVVLVSAADKLHNARAIVADLRTSGQSVWERFNAPAPKAVNILRYYDDLIAAFRATGHHASLVSELARTVDEMRRLSA